MSGAGTGFGSHVGAEERHIVIVGGGISGLSAAFYARARMKAQGIRGRITVMERSERLGGKLHTLHRDGFVIEKGADSFLARKLPIIELTRELGLEAELAATNPQAKTYILHRGRLHRMPPGVVLGIPTEIGPFLKTGLVSPLGKLRAGLDLILPRRESEEDESLGGFLHRRLGSEVLEHVAEPLLAGIYASDTYRMSLRATFPQFHAVERKYGSLIRGMMASRRSNAAEAANLPNIARSSMFLTYRGGLVRLIERLAEVLAGDADIVTGCGVARLETLSPPGREAARAAGGGAVSVGVSAASGGGAGAGGGRDGARYRLTLDDGRQLEADAVIVTLPAPATAALLPEMREKAYFVAMEYVSVANVVMAFDSSDIGCKMDGSGFVIPRREGRFITACTWTSKKWLHSAPAGKTLLRMYVGRAGEQEWVTLSDEELTERVRRDLRELMGITAAPQFVEVTRLMHSMPQYSVGHPTRVRQLMSRLADDYPGLEVCGSAYNGVGIPDCVRQAKEAAARAVAAMVAAGSAQPPEEAGARQ